MRGQRGREEIGPVRGGRAGSGPQQDTELDSRGKNRLASDGTSEIERRLVLAEEEEVVVVDIEGNRLASDGTSAYNEGVSEEERRFVLAGKVGPAPQEVTELDSRGENRLTSDGTSANVEGVSVGERRLVLAEDRERNTEQLEDTMIIQSTYESMTTDPVSPQDASSSLCLEEFLTLEPARFSESPEISLSAELDFFPAAGQNASELGCENIISELVVDTPPASAIIEFNFPPSLRPPADEAEISNFPKNIVESATQIFKQVQKRLSPVINIWYSIEHRYTLKRRKIRVPSLDSMLRREHQKR